MRLLLTVCAVSELRTICVYCVFSTMQSVMLNDIVEQYVPAIWKFSENMGQAGVDSTSTTSLYSTVKT